MLKTPVEHCEGAPRIDPLVSVEWLASNLGTVKILDGTWVLPTDVNTLAEGVIPHAQVFDLDIVADTRTHFKHMLPAPEVFAKAVSEIGISETDTVICYDRHGMFSAPRLWWTFKMFGHENVFVLDGGLPAWIKAGHKIATQPPPITAVPYTPATPLQNVMDHSGVKTAMGKIQTIDARPLGRFKGTSPEPRADLRSGHIPHSLSLPFSTLKTGDGHFKPLEHLKEHVQTSGIDLTAPMIATCGSGITAAGLAFTFYRLGAKDISLYDGSWAEWGASTAPVTPPYT